MGALIVESLELMAHIEMKSLMVSYQSQTTAVMAIQLSLHMGSDLDDYEDDPS